MNFHEIQFPTALSFGSMGGPQRRTDIVTLANGFEERNTPWANSRRSYDAGMGMRSLDDIDTLIAFFEARQGQMFGFRWKDWADYRSCKPSETVGFEDQVIAVGDGQTQAFQLIKTYASGAYSYARPVTKPVLASVLIGIEGLAQQEAIDWEVDLTTGIVSFTHPPDSGLQITAGYEFDVPVRFGTDAIQTSVESFQAGEVPNVPVVEVRI